MLFQPFPGFQTLAEISIGTMSNAALDWAWKQRGLSCAEHCVLARIADRADSDGKCWPSVPGLADETGSGERTVTRALGRLAILGLLRIERKLNSHSTYWCQLGTTATAAPVPERQVVVPQRHQVVPESALGGAWVADEPKGTHINPHRTLKAPKRLGGLKEYPADFEAFWSAYPRKKKKRDALKAWSAIKPSDELVAKILVEVERSRMSRDWRKQAGQFIPYPATWLRADGWEDDNGNGHKPEQSMREIVDELFGEPKAGNADQAAHDGAEDLPF